MASTEGAGHQIKRSRRVGRYRIRRQTAPGTPPGTIAPEPTAPTPTITVTRYTAEIYEEQVVRDLRLLPAILQKGGTIWCDVDGLGDSTIMAQLAQIFGLHALAMEDVVNTHQRAKVEEYGNVLFIVMRFPHVVGKSGVIESEQVSLFLGKNFLLTFQPYPGDAFLPIRKRLHEATSVLRDLGPDYLAYALIDLTIDHYFPILDRLAERLETLDDQITTSDPRKVLGNIHDLRRELLYLRRTLWPHRDAIQVLTRNHSNFLTEPTRVHLRDCWDHVMALVDLTETYRELCADLRDFCMSAISNRMNEVMKWLTLIATVFIPLSFIAGVYGMNFDPEASPWNMPELRWYFGYPFCLALMLVVAGTMIWSFYRRGWIGYDWPLPPSNGKPQHPKAAGSSLPAAKNNSHSDTCSAE
ncbi:MAG: magnesium/cobalt transporter CorA [Thermogutta sp.]